MSIHWIVNDIYTCFICWWWCSSRRSRFIWCTWSSRHSFKKTTCLMYVSFLLCREKVTNAYVLLLFYKRKGFFASSFLFFFLSEFLLFFYYASRKISNLVNDWVHTTTSRYFKSIGNKKNCAFISINEYKYMCKKQITKVNLYDK